MSDKWVKCRDSAPRNPMKPCRHACDPKRKGMLGSMAMAKLGYVTCARDDAHYLANADRECDGYEV